MRAPETTHTTGPAKKAGANVKTESKAKTIQKHPRGLETAEDSGNGQIGGSVEINQTRLKTVENDGTNDSS
jgi:hypothetical protein